MKLLRGIMGLVIIGVIVLLLSLAGLVGDFTSGLIGPHITLDGLLLAMVCLMMGGLFALMLLLLAKDMGWLPSRQKKAEASASNPSKPGAGK